MNRELLKALNDSKLILSDQFHIDFECSLRSHLKLIWNHLIRGPLFFKQVTGRELLFGSMVPPAPLNY